MGRKSLIELTCDYCGCAEHFPIGTTNTSFRSFGWVVTADGKHFCNKKHLNAYRKQENG